MLRPLELDNLLRMLDIRGRAAPVVRRGTVKQENTIMSTQPNIVFLSSDKQQVWLRLLDEAWTG